jgi:hypothetical protein
MQRFKFDRERASSYLGSQAREWVAALANTGKFVRGERSQALFVLIEDPLETMPIGRKDELFSLLAEAEENGLFKIECANGELTDEDRVTLYRMFADNRWRLPSVRGLASQTVPA